MASPSPSQQVDCISKGIPLNAAHLDPWLGEEVPMMKRSDALTTGTAHAQPLVSPGEPGVLMELADPHADAPIGLCQPAMDATWNAHQLHGGHAVVRVMLDGIPFIQWGQFGFAQWTMQAQSDHELAIGQPLEEGLQCILQRKGPRQIGDGDADVVCAGPACQGPGRLRCRRNSTPKLDRKGRKTTHGIHSVSPEPSRLSWAEGRQR